MHLSRLLLRSSEPPAMGIVRQMLKNAMKSGNNVEKTTLRAVIAAVKNADISKPGSITNNVAFGGLVNSLINKRIQSIDEYTRGNRSDLVDKEKDEVSVLNSVVKQLELASPEELQNNLLEFIKELNLDQQAKDAFKLAMSRLPKNVEDQWRAPKSTVVAALKKHFGNGKRSFSTSPFSAHDNPLGLRRRSQPETDSSKGANKAKRIPQVGRVILVSSAKGGVGKSTVAVNLALSLQELGHSAGILDADIFGPSIPKMLGLESVGEPLLNSDGTKLMPMIGHGGLKCMSMGFLIPAQKSLSWRGLLVQKALHQLLFEVHWGGLEYLVVDMPPGTSDVQLTVGQQLAVDGAVIVSTPQQIAQIDVVRGINLFDTLKIPVLGVVENMAYFQCPCCDTQTRIFGKNLELGLPTLAEIPLIPEIATQADSGKFQPRQVYMDLASKIMKQVG